MSDKPKISQCEVCGMFMSQEEIKDPRTYLYDADGSDDPCSSIPVHAHNRCQDKYEGQNK